jgi:hypothetical protein
MGFRSFPQKRHTVGTFSEALWAGYHCLSAPLFSMALELESPSPAGGMLGFVCRGPWKDSVGTAVERTPLWQHAAVDRCKGDSVALTLLQVSLLKLHEQFQSPAARSSSSREGLQFILFPVNLPWSCATPLNFPPFQGPQPHPLWWGLSQPLMNKDSSLLKPSLAGEGPGESSCSLH